MKLKFIFIFFISFSLSVLSQETEQVKKDTSIQGQFDEIYRISTTYQVYKVISKDKYQILKKNVLDSIKNLKTQISEKENLLKSEREKIKNTNELLSKTQADLVASNKKENSISLFGIQLSKIKYNLLLWSIIIISLLLLFYFIFKFFRSNVLTKEAKNNLLDVEQEFEEHRKKSLEREQKLRRQLQDEINKSRNS
ncbi:hypothetical protein [Polaribacter sp. R77954]|uniref:hypothetical protein n=1 Tax=Polaribacter sp. R77954 TaxID=3093870 RepID=UPI0037CAEC22